MKNKSVSCQVKNEFLFVALCDESVTVDMGVI